MDSNSKWLKVPDEWWVNAFGKAWYPLDNVENHFKFRTVQEISSLKKILGLKTGATILDLACGTGRHSLALAREGYKVTGVDFSAPYLKQARAKAKQANLKAKFIRSDMRKISFQNHFDAVLNLFTSFGYLKSASEEKMVLKRIFRALRPNGIFILDHRGLEFTKKNFVSEQWQELPDGSFILERRKTMSAADEILTTEWVILDPSGKKRRFYSAVRFYTEQKIRRLLKEIGFRKVRVHLPLHWKKEEHRKPYPRLVISAQK